MPELSVEANATVGARTALLFPVAAGVTSRPGVLLIVIGVVFSLLPFVSEMASSWVAG